MKINLTAQWRIATGRGRGKNSLNCVIPTHVTYKITHGDIHLGDCPRKISNRSKFYLNLRGFRSKRFSILLQRFNSLLKCFSRILKRSGLTIQRSGYIAQSIERKVLAKARRTPRSRRVVRNLKSAHFLLLLPPWDAFPFFSFSYSVFLL